MSNPAPSRIGDLIEAPPVRTVVRIEDGVDRGPATWSEFVLTEEVARHLEVIAENLSRDQGKGLFLRGDFGSGKSHFLAALAAALGGRLEPDTPAGPLERAVERGRLLVVPVSLVRHRAAESLESILVTEVERSLAATGSTARLSSLARFQDHMREVLRVPALASAFARRQGLATEELASWLDEHPREAMSAGWSFLKEQGLDTPEALVETRAETIERSLAATREAGFRGLLFLIDELSEFLQSKPSVARLNEDARTLQLLGELASEEPLWILCAVQESVESVGDIAGPTLRKIKDRYPVVLSLSTLHIRELISKRLVRHLPGADDEIHRIFRDMRRAFPGFRTSLDQFRAIYPVHPVTLELLEGLSDLLSQHRGIVDFVHRRICGDPERGITGILDRPPTELLAPDSIYDHFEQRLAEFSDFHVYPRHVVPQLDELIDRTLAQEDRALARRIVRILVLYAIHPTAETPPVDTLTQLVSCMLAPQDPSLGVAFVAEAILDPLVEESPFLVKSLGDRGGGPVYAITTERDHSRTLRARLDRARAAVDADDTRIVLEPLERLEGSTAWPATLDVLRDRERPWTRRLAWRNSQRSVLVAWVDPGEEAALGRWIETHLDEGTADFALVLAWGGEPMAARHTAVWRLPAPPPEAAAEVLLGAYSIRKVARALRSSSPADAPILPLVEEPLRRAEAECGGALLDVVYEGRFELPESHGGIEVEPAVRQLRRFQRLIDLAAQVVLEERYPLFKEIAPPGPQGEPRLYARLFEDVIRPGSLSFTAARRAGLTESIESLVVPLGLAEVRGGAYRVNPDPARHGFLGHLFGLLRPATSVPAAEVRRALSTGAYGVPAATIDFTLAALAHAGAISLLQGGRRVAIEFLVPASMTKVDAVASGERISPGDQKTLLSECRFLLGDGEYDSFGLRQQRAAWDGVVRFADRARKLADQLEAQARRVRHFSAYESFGWERIESDLGRLREVAGEVKVSYPAREGLERFLAAWRGSGLSEERIIFLERVLDFLPQRGEELVFVAHYLRHQAVAAAAETDPEVAAAVVEVRAYYDEPHDRVIADGGAALGEALERLRTAYGRHYAAAHDAHQRALERPKLTAAQDRIVGVLRRLAQVPTLDRPAGLPALLAWAGGGGRPCRRDLGEELLRSPVCSCGFVPGSSPPVQGIEDPDREIEGALDSYLGLLADPRLLESFRAHVYSRAQVAPEASARLAELVELLSAGERPGAPALLERLDEVTLTEAEAALAGGTRLERRPIEELVRTLSGRRLTPEGILDLVRQWLAGVAGDSIVAIDSASAGAGAHEAPAVAWWPSLHPSLLEGASPPAADIARDARLLAEALEATYPAASLARNLAQASTAELLDLVAREPCHVSLVREAWGVLCGRVIDDPRSLPSDLTPEARLVDPTERNALMLRLQSLTSLAQLHAVRSFPDRLQARLALSAVGADPWATRSVTRAAAAAIDRLATAGTDWLDSLQPPPVIDPGDLVTVLLLDGAAADVLLAALASVEALAPDELTWHGLAVPAETLPSIAALFGLDPRRDPSDSLAERGAVYESLTGDEDPPLAELLPAPPDDRALLVRVTFLDRAAHAGTTSLHDMPQALAAYLSRNLPALVAACRNRGRNLILTTDHGLSLTPRGLTHGKGGVFERAIFRVTWSASDE